MTFGGVLAVVALPALAVGVNIARRKSSNDRREEILSEPPPYSGSDAFELKKTRESGDPPSSQSDCGSTPDA